MLKAKYWVFFQVIEFYKSENSVIIIGQILASSTTPSQNDPALYFLKKNILAARNWNILHISNLNKEYEDQRKGRKKLLPGQQRSKQSPAMTNSEVSPDDIIIPHSWKAAIQTDVDVDEVHLF